MTKLTLLETISHKVCETGTIRHKIDTIGDPNLTWLGRHDSNMNGGTNR